MENMEKKAPLSELVDTAMSRIRELVDSNTIVGTPINTPDGVTVIPISRVSFGFGNGGGYGKSAGNFNGGAGGGVRIEPVSFLIIKDGVTRVLPVSVPAVNTVDRVLDLVPEMFDRVENLVAKKREEKDIL